MKSMGNNKSATFNEFVSDALTQENNNNVYAASKNHKRAFEASASQAKALVAKTQFRPPTTAIRTGRHSRRIRQRLVSRKHLLYPFQRAPPDQGILLFHQQTGHAGIVAGQVIGPRIVLILRRTIRSRGILVLVKGMLTTLM